MVITLIFIVLNFNTGTKTTVEQNMKSEVACINAAKDLMVKPMPQNVIVATARCEIKGKA